MNSDREQRHPAFHAARAALGAVRLVFTLLGLGVAIAASGQVPGDDGFVVIDSVAQLREYAAKDHVKVRLRPGVYRLEEADSHHFLRFTGRGGHFDLRGAKLLIDNRLFRRFAGADGFYCAIDLIGDDIVLEGLTTENLGREPGLQGRNKIFNVVGSNVVVRDVDITTSGSSPWGYGSLFGIASGDVRKMNGIRVGYPAKGVKLVNCRVHMRAMGHAIFVQGAVDTLIENCHVDGLLRPTDEILAETSGYAFDRGFKTRGHDYIEGVTVGPDGGILPGEMIALSEDGIRLYDQGGGGHPTGSTTIRGCTVVRMRRGICTGLGPAADRVIDCEARDCVAAGFNIGGGDVLENCRADARYAEALSCPYPNSAGARVELDILDSRGGRANSLLAVINGRDHVITLKTSDPAFVPESHAIELGSRRGYAFYQREDVAARGIVLHNLTRARRHGP